MVTTSTWFVSLEWWYCWLLHSFLEYVDRWVFFFFFFFCAAHQIFLLLSCLYTGRSYIYIIHLYFMFFFFASSFFVTQGHFYMVLILVHKYVICGGQQILMKLWVHYIVTHSSKWLSGGKFKRGEKNYLYFFFLFFCSLVVFQILMFIIFFSLCFFSQVPIHDKSCNVDRSHRSVRSL